MSAENLNYFAYGSNMAEQTVTSLAPSATKLGVARLADYRLAFTRKSIRWKAGVADVVRCPGMSVYGILYAIRTEDLARLDRKEGVPKAYRRVSVTVIMNHSATPATTYAVATPESLEVQPSIDYMDPILQAANEHKMPESYLDFLEYLEKQFGAGTRDDGLLLTPTSNRRFSAGVPLIRLNPSDSGRVRHGSFGVLIMGDKRALGKVEVTDAVSAGTCEADQSLRVCVGVGGQFCFGNRVTVAPCQGNLPRPSPIRPRALVLPLYAISQNDSEKNYCVMHPDRIKVLGLQEGEFARLFAATPPTSKDENVVEVKAITIRVFSGSASEVGRLSGKFLYPDRSEFYLDKDGRGRLGLPETGWLRTPVLIRPALLRALSNRAIFYGLTALLGIGAFFQILQAFETHWSSYVDVVVSLAASGALTMALSIIDLRSRYHY